MGEGASESGPGGFSGLIAENRLADDWLAYVALVPGIAIAIAAAIYFATITSWHNRIVPNAASVKEARGELDGYVEALAKLGIAQLPDNDRSVTGFGPGGGPGSLIQVVQACIA
jgi:hypothetical protein